MAWQIFINILKGKTIKTYLFSEMLKKTLKGCKERKITIIKYLHSTLKNIYIKKCNEIRRNYFINIGGEKSIFGLVNYSVGLKPRMHAWFKFQWVRDDRETNFSRKNINNLDREEEFNMKKFEILKKINGKLINMCSNIQMSLTFNQQRKTPKKPSTKGKIEFLNKLLWITTLPNTCQLNSTQLNSTRKEKTNSKIADANYLILTLFADTMSDGLSRLVFVACFESIGLWSACEFASSIEFMFERKTSCSWSAIGN